LSIFLIISGDFRTHTTSNIIGNIIGHQTQSARF
jgi:hypothetical protein